MKSPYCREEAETASNLNEVDLELIGFSSFYKLNTQILQLILAECLRFEGTQLLLEAHVDLFLLY